jgi:hypothetical protein
MKLHPWLLFMAICITPTAEATVTVTSEDIVVHMDAMPSTELTPEAAARYNVEPAKNRGILTVSALKQGKNVPMQVFVGAINSKNNLINVPMRATNGKDGSSYIGEYYLLPADTLNFIVNVNVLGKPLKAKFNRAFTP